MIYRLMTTNNFSQHLSCHKSKITRIKIKWLWLHQISQHTKHLIDRRSWAWTSHTKTRLINKKINARERDEKIKRRQWRDIYVALVFRWRLTYFKYILWLLVTQTFAMSFIFSCFFISSVFFSEGDTPKRAREKLFLIFFLCELSCWVLGYSQRHNNLSSSKFACKNEQWWWWWWWRTRKKRCVVCAALRYFLFFISADTLSGWIYYRVLRKAQASGDV